MPLHTAVNKCQEAQQLPGKDQVRMFLQPAGYTSYATVDYRGFYCPYGLFHSTKVSVTWNTY